MQTKKCPSCSIDMREIAMKTKYEIPFVVEQCEQCGGLWFDDLELYLAKLGEAGAIDGVDLLKLRKTADAAPQNLVCPNDGERLKSFKDPSFPETLELDKCPQCNGFWLNRGEFAAFQENRQAHIDAQSKNAAAVDISKDDGERKLSEQLDKMLASSSSGSYEALGSLGGFLSQPLNSYTCSPLEGSSADKEKAAAIISAGAMLIRLLIELFVKKF